jgi:hypothetical protein
MNSILRPNDLRRNVYIDYFVGCALIKEWINIFRSMTREKSPQRIRSLSDSKQIKIHN